MLAPSTLLFVIPFREVNNLSLSIIIITLLLLLLLSNIYFSAVAGKYSPILWYNNQQD
jgi:hypothetical protein